MRTIAGYTITQSIRIGNVEFVLGENLSDRARYVTWECKNETDCYWGHYTTDKLAALRDLLNRAGTELTFLETCQELNQDKHQQLTFER